MADQRANARLLTRAEQIQIQALLSLPELPTGAVGQQSAAGSSSAPGQGPTVESADVILARLVKRAQKEYGDVIWRKTAYTLPMTAFEAAGQAAKTVVEPVFAAWTANAVLTDDVRARREKHAFKGDDPGRNLLEWSDAKLRKDYGSPVSAREMAKSYAATDSGARAFRRHEGDTALDKQVITLLAKDYPTLLEECDRFGYATADPVRGLVYVLGAVDTRKTSDQGRAERDRKVDVFFKLVHEYVHVLEHPSIPAATAKSETVREGVAEYFTCHAIAACAAWPEERHRELLRTIVGGAFLEEAERLRSFRQRLREYKPASDYADFHRDVTKAVALIGTDGLPAAYLQGHIEYLGVLWSGSWIAPVTESGGMRSLPVPDDLRSLGDLHSATGLSENAIVGANPDTADALWGGGAGWPKEIFLPGFRPHLVQIVQSITAVTPQPPATGTSGGGTQADAVPSQATATTQTATETWEQIARQHDVDIVRLRNVNRLLTGDPAGRWILVPRPPG
jgi:hypothetical protein